MVSFELLSSIHGRAVHLVGAKGTGMCALAEILVAAGATVTGSDVSDLFYTDAILESIGIIVTPFSASNIQSDITLLVYSAAYHPDTNPELIRAGELGIPIASYPEALGAISRTMNSSGICGVHGKTTTTALSGIVAKALGLPATVLAGSGVSAFGNRSTLILGNRFFIAETCEYRRHFLSFSPVRILLTSVESDHQDYYPDYEAIMGAFVEYLNKLPQGGILIFCADDPGAQDAVQRICGIRTDIKTCPYGFTAEGTYKILTYQVVGERARFKLAGFDMEFSLKIPGRHTALNATAAMALCFGIFQDNDLTLSEASLKDVALALSSFSGSRRRSEIIGEAGGVLFIDDYAHHPTAIRTTLAGFKEFYPDRRIVVDFMSHTYSRTKALFEDFATAFKGMDVVILHKIYASAREALDLSISGKTLWEAVVANGTNAKYYEEPLDAIDYLESVLRPGDLFITMGAGDNWLLGKALFERFASRTASGNEEKP